MTLGEVQRYITENAMISPGQRVLAAVSGGIDSVCMLHMLKNLSGKMGFELEAAHFNHNLRGAESDADAEFTGTLCKNWGIAFHLGSGDVACYARQRGLGVEEAARVLRYEFLEKTASVIGADRIATAHNADDNAETVLFNLTRGAGVKGLQGIPPVRGKIIRPVLILTREKIQRYMEENGLDHVEDSTNAKQDYTRNRLRHSVMPVLRQINPNVSGGIMDTKQLLSWDDDFIGGYAEEFVQNNFVSGHISARKLAGLHPAVAGRVVKKLCPGADFEHVKSVLELCKGKKASQSISVPGMTVRREYDDITFGATPKEEIEQRILPIGQRIQIPEINAGVRVYEGKNSDKIYKTFNTFLFKKSSIYGSIVLRSRRTGDKVNISGCTKQLKKLFIEKHIPSSQRQSIPVLADDRGVVAVFGMGIDRRCLSRKGDDVIIIEFEELI